MWVGLFGWFCWGFVGFFLFALRVILFYKVGRDIHPALLKYLLVSVPQSYLFGLVKVVLLKRVSAYFT